MFVIYALTFKLFALECALYNVSHDKNCQAKKVHLTFDDGPNTTTTPKVLKSLSNQNVPATFFISTHQLEKGDLVKKEKLLNSMLEKGFTLASHGHDHNCHDYRIDWNGKVEQGYSDVERRHQIGKSLSLLNKFTQNKFQKQNHQLIRFPYGRGISPSPKEIELMVENGRYIEGETYREQLAYYRANSPAMSIASEYNLSHIGWNHDSKDASSKYNQSNQDRYIDDILNAWCGSSQSSLVSLFHDTREINSLPSNIDKSKTVIEEIIERAKCLGVQFVSINEILKHKLQSGVYTQAYNTTEKIEQMIRQKETIQPREPAPVCPLVENSHQSTPKPCYSKYLGGEIEHCEGITSFCIDGQWITSKNLKQLACVDNINIDTVKELSSMYLNKPCAQSSQPRVFANREVTCYCKPQQGDKMKFNWQCYDTRERPHKHIH